MAILNDDGSTTLTPQEVATLTIASVDCLWALDPFTPHDAQECFDAMAWIDFSRLTPTDEQEIIEAIVSEYYRIVQPSLDIEKAKPAVSPHKWNKTPGS